jgi:hypothetical protein
MKTTTGPHRGREELLQRLLEASGAGLVHGVPKKLTTRIDQEGSS